MVLPHLQLAVCSINQRPLGSGPLAPLGQVSPPRPVILAIPPQRIRVNRPSSPSAITARSHTTTPSHANAHLDNTGTLADIARQMSKLYVLQRMRAAERQWHNVVK